MAPEIHFGYKYRGDKVDVFSAGVILFEMVAQKPPFVSAKKTDRYYMALCKNPAMFWKIMKVSFPDELKDLI